MTTENKELANFLLWDLNKIVTIVNDQTKVLGKLDIESWRFPHKSFKELDLLELINNQKSPTELERYIFLLEMVYDLLHLVINYYIKALEKSLKYEHSRSDILCPQKISLSSLLSITWERIKTLPKPHKSTVISELEERVFNDVFAQTGNQELKNCECCYISEEFLQKLIEIIYKSSNRLNFPSAVCQVRETMRNKLCQLSDWGAINMWAESVLLDVNSLVQMNVETKIKHQRKEKRNVKRQKLKRSEVGRRKTEDKGTCTPITETELEGAEEIDRLRERCRKLEKEIEKKNEETEGYGEENKILQFQLDSLLSETETLKMSLIGMTEEVQKFKKAVLVDYPELSSCGKKIYKGTGNPIVDMENQKLSNEIRIRELTDHNVYLTELISKIQCSKIASSSRYELLPTSS